MANLVLKNNTAANDVSLEFNRGSNASWRIVNSSGTLYMRCNYTSSAGDYYDALSLAYSSGNLWVKGSISAPSLTLSSVTEGSQTAASSPALRIGDSDSAIHLLIDRDTINAKATSTTAGTLHLNESGGLVRIGSGGLTVIGNITGTLIGNASTATQFSSTRTITLTGDVSGSASSTGGNGWTITTTVANDSHTHNTTIGWADRQLTVTAGGVSAKASIPTALTGFASITSAKFIGALQGNADTSTQFSSTRTIALTGDVTGSVSSTGASGWSITTTIGANNHIHDASAAWSNRTLTISVGGGGASSSATIPTNLTGFSNISSTAFTGALVGNADTATQFASATTVSLSGAVTGTSAASTRGLSIVTSINKGVSWSNRQLTITVGNGTASGSIPTTLTGFVSITSQTLIATTKMTIPVQTSSYTSTTAGEIWIVA